VIASDCRALKGRMSFAGCDDLVVDEGTADMVAAILSQPCRIIGRRGKYGLVIRLRSEEWSSVAEMGYMFNDARQTHQCSR